jgi:ABC-type transport system involved in multi-copper enzyme maturation permease subunit
MLGITNYLYRLIPANPILLRVVENGGKRRRDLFIRCGYLGLLIAVVIFGVLSKNTTDASLAELAKTSTNVFQSLSYFQLALVALLAPVFTAGAITQEKDSQTYDILLATPLSNGQIVLGSLLSRLFFIVILLISGIPIFSITQIFGGVATSSIFVSFLIAAATAFVTGSLAMAIATFKVGSRRTIFGFYLFIVIYLVGLGLLDQLSWFHPIIKYDTDPADVHKLVPIFSSTSWLTGLHPFLALRTLFFDKTYTPPKFGELPAELQRWPMGWYLSSPASFYITFMFVLSFLLVTPSVILLRWLAQTNMPFKTWILTRLHLSKGDRTRKPRTVWNNPIAWREAKTKGSATRASVLRYGFTIIGILSALALVYEFSGTEEATTFIRPDSYNAATHSLTVYEKDAAHQYAIIEGTDGTQITYKRSPADTNGRPGTDADFGHHYSITVEANPNNTLASVTLMPIPHKISEDNVRNYLLAFVVLEFAVILLIVTNAAASTVTREKEDGTLDLLLTTPITSRYYIWGKLRGLVYFVLPLVAVPVASIAIFVLYDALRFTSDSSSDRWIAFPESVIILPGMLIVIAAFAAILGMQLSLKCRTSVMAVMASLGIVIGACGALGWCGYTFLNYHSDTSGFSLFVGSFSPFTLMTMLINPYQFTGRNFDNPSDESGNRLTIFISTIAAVAGYATIVWAMYRSMVKNFDMTIRRQQR